GTTAGIEGGGGGGGNDQTGDTPLPEAGPEVVPSVDHAHAAHPQHDRQQHQPRGQSHRSFSSSRLSALLTGMYQDNYERSSDVPLRRETRAAPQALGPA